MIVQALMFASGEYCGSVPVAEMTLETQARRSNR